MRRYRWLLRLNQNQAKKERQQKILVNQKQPAQDRVPENPINIAFKA